MQRMLSLCLVAALLAGSAGPAQAKLDPKTIGKGLLEALKVGIDNAIEKTGVEDGFLGNEAIKILLPEELQPVAKIAKKVGAGKLVEELVVKMNRAAESAVPSARDIFMPAIEQLTFQDAYGILKGKEDEASQYLRKTSGEVLVAAFLPVVTEQIESVGALKSYHDLVGKAQSNPLLAGFGSELGINLDDFNLNTYVTNQAVDGLFLVLAEEEQKIRENPEARATTLLKNVFGSILKKDKPSDEQQEEESDVIENTANETEEEDSGSGGGIADED